MRAMAEGSRKYDPEWLRHHKRPVALCRRGSGQQLIRELGLCTPQEWANSMRAIRAVKARNRFWAVLGYPNLVRARAAKAEAARRRRLMGLRPRDHSLDHVLEVCAPLLPQVDGLLRSRACISQETLSARVAAQPIPPRNTSRSVARL